MDTATTTTAQTWAEFQQRWSGPCNFLLGRECAPPAFDLPPLDRVIAELRDDEFVRITPGARDSRLRLEDTAAQFRALPIEQALAGPFALAHFKLSRFDAPGKCLHGFKTRVLDRWEAALQQAGFTFDRCYPIVFISGKGCSTNYHMDFSHVLAWQVYGRKRFCGLQDPDHWAPREARVTYQVTEFARPDELTDADALCYDMAPGDVLWNAFLTPHWVEAGDGVAMSINISHGGLRYRGELCPNERELIEYRAAHPELPPAGPKGGY